MKFSLCSMEINMSFLLIEESGPFIPLMYPLYQHPDSQPKSRLLGCFVYLIVSCVVYDGNLGNSFPTKKCNGFGGRCLWGGSRKENKTQKLLGETVASNRGEWVESYKEKT